MNLNCALTGDHIRAARARGLESCESVSYTHLRAHETVLDLVCRLLLEKKKSDTTYDTDRLHTSSAPDVLRRQHDT